jgi:hypothetical protein
MKISLLLPALFYVLNVNAQVGVGTITPAPSAVFEVKSSSKGFLPPRLTTVQIKAITLPEEGLMVYNTTYHKPCFFDGYNWVYYDSSRVLPEVGKYWPEGGGIVISVDGSGLHGYIAATIDQGYVIYGCSGTNIPGAQFTAVGKGQTNTTAILALCGTPGIAAKLCDDLVLNGRSDWFLPSKEELMLMYQQKNFLSNLGSGYFISSSQISAISVWMIDFSIGTYIMIPPSSTRNVRAISSF